MGLSNHQRRLLEERRTEKSAKRLVETAKRKAREFMSNQEVEQLFKKKGVIGLIEKCQINQEVSTKWE